MYKHCMESFIPREKTIKRKETDMETSFQIMIYFGRILSNVYLSTCTSCKLFSSERYAFLCTLVLTLDLFSQRIPGSPLYFNTFILSSTLI